MIGSSRNTVWRPMKYIHSCTLPMIAPMSIIRRMMNLTVSTPDENIQVPLSPTARSYDRSRSLPERPPGMPCTVIKQMADRGIQANVKNISTTEAPTNGGGPPNQFPTQSHPILPSVVISLGMICTADKNINVSGTPSHRFWLFRNNLSVQTLSTPT